MRSYYFPPLVKEKIMSHFAPYQTEERQVWEALSKWYITASKNDQTRFSLRSFRTKHLKRGGMGLYKYTYTRFPHSRRREGMGGSMEAERYWFLLKGFSESDRYWEFWDSRGDVCTLRIRKGILHAIHSEFAWFRPNGGRRLWYRDCRGRRRASFARWHYKTRNLCAFHRDRGDFVPNPAAFVGFV